MHILLIHQIFVTPEEGGGTRHYELARCLVEKGHRVTVIASRIDYLTGRRKGKKREVREGIEIIYSRAYRSVHKSFFQRALSFLSFAVFSFIDALTVKNIDVVWGTSPPFFQSLSSLAVSILKRKPFIAETRDLWVDFAEELGIVNNRFIINCMKQLEKMIYRASKKIVVNSPGFIPFIEKKIEDRNKIHLIPNGVITGEFNVNKGGRSFFGSDDRSDNTFIAIYLGNIGVANDIETIIEAAKKLSGYKDILFVIMGGGIKKMEFERYVSENNISNVKLIGSLPKAEIPGILAEVDVCIATLKNIPLFRTTYPNKVFDYMAAEKPTALAIDGVMREVIEASEGGTYVEPGNSTHLANAILNYYKFPWLADWHGKNAREYVKKHFEREKIADDLEALFVEVEKDSFVINEIADDIHAYSDTRFKNYEDTVCSRGETELYEAGPDHQITDTEKF